MNRVDVLRTRAAAQGLGREAATAFDVPVLALGVQDSPPGAARLALAARTRPPAVGPATPATPAVPDPAWWEDDDRLTSAWSVRGAPHVHRRADLPALAAALWPHDDVDAAARLAWNATRVRETGRPPLEVLAATVAAVAEVAALDPATLDATGIPPVERRDGEVGLSKGLLSREVGRRMPRELLRWCEPCRVEHVFEQALRLTALPGGLAVEGGSPVVLAPFAGPDAPGRVPPGWVPPGDPGDLGPLVRAYLHLYAPATPADVRTFLGASLAVVKAHWPADAVPVRVTTGTGSSRTGTGARQAWALPDDVATLSDPPTPPHVRLLPPNDAVLKAGDRDLLVPDRTRQKVIWRVLGSPGVLLLDAEPAGVWRPRATGGRLDLTVEPFTPLPATAHAALEVEAERMAAVRGLRLARLTV